MVVDFRLTLPPGHPVGVYARRTSLTMLDTAIRLGSPSPRGRSRDPRPLSSTPRIAGLAVADWREPLTQDDVLDRLGLADDEFAQRVFSRSGVRQRHLNL